MKKYNVTKSPTIPANNTNTMGSIVANIEAKRSLSASTFRALASLVKYANNNRQTARVSAKAIC